MKYVLNSAVVTTPGNYNYRLISPDKAKEWLKNNEWESTVSYLQTADALNALTGIIIPVNKKNIRMRKGDEALVFRLRARLDRPEFKGKIDVKFVLKHCEIGILKKTR